MFNQRPSPFKPAPTLLKSSVLRSLSNSRYSGALVVYAQQKDVNFEERKKQFGTVVSADSRLRGRAHRPMK
jgi:hypothetical protein